MSGWAEAFAQILGDGGSSPAVPETSDQSAAPKSKTRPHGLRGSHGYRAALRRQEEQEQQDIVATGGIARAREALAKKRQEAKAAEQALAIRDEQAIVPVCRNIGSDLQRRLGKFAHRISLPMSPIDTLEDSSFAMKMLFDTKRPVTSFMAEAAMHGFSDPSTAKRQTMLCASGLLSGSSYLWGCTLANIADLVQNNKLVIHAVVKKRRYDETRSNIQVPIDPATAAKQGGGIGVSTEEKSKYAKVVQSEFQIGLLLQDVQTEEFMFARGVMPTSLVAVDSCTAEVFRFLQKRIEQSVPELLRIASLSRMSVQMVNTDRHASNIKAEKAIHADSKGLWVKSHYPCDHHDTASSLGKALGLAGMQRHVAGMLAAALSMQGAGETLEFRKALCTVIDSRLDIRVGRRPEGIAQAHREAVLDTFLPLKGPRASKKSRRLRYLQRFILNTCLNGDLQNSDAVEVYVTSFLPDIDKIKQIIHRFVVPCLVPSKPPVFPRGKWTHTEDAIEFFGLIDAHHSLLHPAVFLWLGKKEHPTGLSERTDQLQLVEADREEAEASTSSTLNPVKAWQEEARQQKLKCQRWASTSPGPELGVLRSAISPIIELTHKLLNRAGEFWEKQQQHKSLKGEDRTYRVLEVFRGTDLKAFKEASRDAFHRHLTVVPNHAQKRSLQVLAFRVQSCLSCAVHYYLELRWSSYPVKLFGLMDGFEDKDVEHCIKVLDPLSAEFFAKFETHEARMGELAQLTLVCLALLFTTGTAEIEARHAATRRLIHVKSVQTHRPTLQTISASWLCRRNASVRSENLPSTLKQKPTGQNADGAQSKTFSKPGGPWRAFVRSQGVKITKETMSDAKEKYHKLDPAEREHFEKVGHAATMAGKSGYNPFGQKRKRGAGQPMVASNLTQHALVPLADPANESMLAAKIGELKASYRQESKRDKEEAAQLLRELSAFREGENKHSATLGQQNVACSCQPFPWHGRSSLTCASYHMPADVVVQAQSSQRNLSGS